MRVDTTRCAFVASRKLRSADIGTSCRNREYAEKQKIMTTHFFQAFSYSPLRISLILSMSTAVAQYCVGNLPENLLKMRLNCGSY
jgi:hypothetical protein